MTNLELNRSGYFIGTVHLNLAFVQSSVRIDDVADLKIKGGIAIAKGLLIRFLFMRRNGSRWDLGNIYSGGEYECTGLF